jgi:hypothetical protein
LPRLRQDEPKELTFGALEPLVDLIEDTPKPSCCRFSLKLKTGTRRRL